MNHGYAVSRNGSFHCSMLRVDLQLVSASNAVNEYVGKGSCYNADDSSTSDHKEVCRWIEKVETREKEVS